MLGIEGRAVAMYFNVSGLLRGRVGGIRRFEFAGELVEHSGFEFRGVEARGSLTRTDRSVLVEAAVRASCDVECARCLADSEIRLAVDFAEEFVPVNIDLVSGGWRGGIDDGTGPDLWIDGSNTLDLSVPLWQSLRAGMPLVSLCSSECKGICSMCYVDRNFDLCECDTIDSSECDSLVPSRLK